MSAAELQVGLGWNADQNGFDVTLHAATDEEIKFIQLPREVLHIKLAALRTLIADPTEYAAMVTGILFGVDGLRDKFIEMITLAEHANIPLNLRLLIDRTAPAEYHTVRWELLWDPRNDQPLALNPLVTLSRFVNPRYQSTFSLRTKGELRALIVAVDPHPETLVDYGLRGSPLAPIDAKAEAEQARMSLGEITSTVVCERGQGTLRHIAARLKQALRDGQGYSIVYLIAHGALHEQGPVLYLENDEGGVAAVSGSSFVEAVTELESRPSLIVLSACQTASSAPGVATSMGESATALGPMLVSDGISAVVAMHGNVAVKTVREFVPSFLKELQTSGSVYQALLEGRKAIREHPDWWAPALFTRMRTGMIFVAPSHQNSDWRRTRSTLIQSMTNGLCTPIIGPGLSAGFFPSRPAVASGLAARLQVPIAPGPSNDLARISQYLVATHRDKMYPRTALVSFLIERIEEDYGLTDEQLRAAEAEAGTRQGGKWLSQLIIQLGRRHRQEHPDDDPYAILAAMEFPIYFTTSFSALLEDALKAAERPARVVDFRATARARPAIPATPNRDHPIVVRLFGGFDDPETLVLTEDDHFNYLTTWATNRSNALRGLKSSLTNNNLLLMGFGLDDWDFRVLFRSILCMEGATQLGQLAHVAVQVNPESETIEADAVQQYLEQYYQREANFSLRWDTPSDFLQELRS